jgi:asparagine synthase (glutamine-hydrolysing)
MYLARPLAALVRYRERLSNFFEMSSTARAVTRDRLTYLSSAKMRRLESVATATLKRGVPGHVAEFGVALGGSAIVLASHARRYGRQFHGFDVFGMIPPPVSDKDDERSKERFEIIASGKSEGIKGDEYYGYRKDLYGEVCRSFQRFGMPVDGTSVQLHKGLFSNTLHSFPRESFAVAHVDCDWYDPVKLCLSEVAKRSAVGSTIVVDDFKAWSGCRAATIEFLSTHSEYIFDDGPNAILKRAL